MNPTGSLELSCLILQLTFQKAIGFIALTSSCKVLHIIRNVHKPFTVAVTRTCTIKEKNCFYQSIRALAVYPTLWGLIETGTDRLCIL